VYRVTPKEHPIDGALTGRTELQLASFYTVPLSPACFALSGELRKMIRLDFAAVHAEDAAQPMALSSDLQGRSN
jgi:hypothetical protein